MALLLLTLVLPTILALFPAGWFTGCHVVQLTSLKSVLIMINAKPVSKKNSIILDLTVDKVANLDCVTET